MEIGRLEKTATLFNFINLCHVVIKGAVYEN